MCEEERVKSVIELIWKASGVSVVRAVGVDELERLNGSDG